MRREAVIHRRHGFVWPPDPEPALPQPAKGLWRSHFMHKVQVNVEHGGRVRLLHDNVPVPDLLKKR